jgi:hypothetical protein
MKAHHTFNRGAQTIFLFSAVVEAFSHVGGNRLRGGGEFGSTWRIIAVQKNPQSVRGRPGRSIRNLRRSGKAVQMMIEDKPTKVKSCSNYIALSAKRDSTSVARRLLPSIHADSICVHFNEGLTS